MQINAFYLEKEAELKMRLETLLMKRRAAATRVLPDSNEDIATKDHVEWSAVEESFHLLERDLGKLQACPSRLSLSRKILTLLSLAMRGDQRDWIPQDPQKVGQAVKINDQGALSVAPGRRAASLQPAGESHSQPSACPRLDEQLVDF